MPVERLIFKYFPYFSSWCYYNSIDFYRRIQIGRTTVSDGNDICNAMNERWVKLNVVSWNDGADLMSGLSVVVPTGQWGFFTLLIRFDRGCSVVNRTWTSFIWTRQFLYRIRWETFIGTNLMDHSWNTIFVSFLINECNNCNMVQLGTLQVSRVVLITFLVIFQFFS